MTNFIPIFPLDVVVYPGENLNLHIFEPRYKQLVTECLAANKPFGIPSVIDKKVKELGAVVEITELTKVYDNGEMDIKTKGLKVFRVLEIIKEIPDKLYSGAIVSYPDNYISGNPELMRQIVSGIKDLHKVLNVKKDFIKAEDELLSYDVAHHAGLSLEEEYELLSLMDERQRQEYLKKHLGKVLPVLTEMEQLKERIKLNGHFKNLGGVAID